MLMRPHLSYYLMNELYFQWACLIVGPGSIVIHKGWYGPPIDRTRRLYYKPSLGFPCITIITMKKLQTSFLLPNLFIYYFFLFYDSGYYAL